jgi:hypothetical protein
MNLLQIWGCCVFDLAGATQSRNKRAAGLIVPYLARNEDRHGGEGGQLVHVAASVAGSNEVNVM